MPVYSMTPALSSGFAVAFGQIGRFASNLHLSVREWNDRRITRKVLSALTDRELADIGLDRSEINSIS